MIEHQHHHADAETVTGWRAYQPLIIVFVSIIITVGFAQYFFGLSGWRQSIRLFMGFFFLTFGFFKVLDWKGFMYSYGEYDIIAAKTRAYAAVYPLLELMIAIAFLTNTQPMPAAFLTFILMIIGSVGIARALRRNRKYRCACLGAVIKLPLSTVTLIEDGLMGIMALLMILKI